MTNRFSEERLNAFVDGEADRDEADRMFGASDSDCALDREIGQLRKLKALVRHAYLKVPPPRRTAARPRQGRAGAVVVFALGLVLGWSISEWPFHPREVIGMSRISLGAQVAAMPGVVIQVADREPASWQLALDQARAVAEGAHGGNLDVVVIAYGPGLDMLRRESGVRDDLVNSLARGIRLVACGNTMGRENVRESDLLPGVTVAGGGATLAILALQRAGYAYVRI